MTFFLDWIGVSEITDVGFVYTAAIGDDTPFQLEIPAHSAGDAIFVVARGTNNANLPAVMEVRDALNNTLSTLTNIAGTTLNFASAIRLMWGILPAGAHQVYGSVNTVQVGIHVYRGVSAIGATAYTTPDVLDSLGADIPALTLEDTGGKSRVWCGVNFNQLKDGASTPDTPTGLTKRLTSPGVLGGGTLVTYDTTDGVTSFPSPEVNALGGAYYTAWAVEMKV